MENDDEVLFNNIAGELDYYLNEIQTGSACLYQEECINYECIISFENFIFRCF